MPETTDRPVLLCFDGSRNSAAAIERAGRLLGARAAVVLTVCEPVAVWEAYDPGAVLSAAVAKFGSKSLGLDEIVDEIANEQMQEGVKLASAAGFAPQGRVAHGKSWRAICDVADEIDADLIVLGARGLSRVESVLLGSVSAAVVAHADRSVLIVPYRLPEQ